MAAPSGTDSFVHLHTHTEFSMLDGAARLDDLFREAARMGMPALAMTDHGNVFGAYEFWRKAKAHGVKPIIDMEGYLAPGSRHERKRAVLARGASGTDDTDNPGEMYTHMTLLAENTEGMHNLFRLSSLASLEGYYYKPRMDRELLATYGKGIIATTGCPSGEVQRLLQQDKFDAACQAARDRLSDGLITRRALELAEESLADFRVLVVHGARQVGMGVVLYTGTRRLPFGDRLVALPAADVWTIW